MPPHCDSLDGPVVTAARKALDATDVDLILPFVHAEGEAEIRDAFDQTVKVRAMGDEARGVADRWFFETAVRVHRAGDGAPFTGLKPAGLDVGPVIPAAERALESGSADALIEVLTASVRDQVTLRHARAMRLETRANDSVEDARAHVEAMLGLQVWAHSVYKQVMADLTRTPAVRADHGVTPRLCSRRSLRGPGADVGGGRGSALGAGVGGCRHRAIGSRWRQRVR